MIIDMIYWKCENKECTEFGKEIIETRPMFKYTNNGTVPINIPYCKVCGKQMGYREKLPESEGDINVAFASFGSQSNENKASILKARYKKGLEKDGVSEMIKAKREKVTKDFFGG